MKLKPFLSALIIILPATLFVVGSVWAQQPTPSDDDVNAIAKQLYCPVCENIPLDVCPTQACIQWRALIREKLAAGETEQEIKDYFVLYYGERVLAEPPRQGINWLIYILPPGMLLLGGVILFFVFRNMRTPVQSTSSSTEKGSLNDVSGVTDQTDEYLRQVEEELKKRQS